MPNEAERLRGQLIRAADARTAYARRRRKREDARQARLTAWKRWKP